VVRFAPWRSADLESVSPEQACAHPNWVMGRKISVDSATMMNKGLEVIEAHWLFNVPAERIQVVIHPESVVHSLVQYADGSVIAELGNPDMRTPIAHALAYPRRIAAGVEPLDLFKVASLHFERPDLERFPCLALAYRALRDRGQRADDAECRQRSGGAGLSRRRIGFTAIPRVIAGVMDGLPAGCARLACRGPDGRPAGPRGRRAVAHVQVARDEQFSLLPGRICLVLGVLVVVHEFGHYLAARWAGVKVCAFRSALAGRSGRGGSARMAPSGRLPLFR
jgi:hypothetical protein